jgi:hypothetical protein
LPAGVTPGQLTVPLQLRRQALLAGQEADVVRVDEGNHEEERLVVFSPEELDGRVLRGFINVVGQFPVHPEETYPLRSPQQGARCENEYRCFFSVRAFRCVETRTIRRQDQPAYPESGIREEAPVLSLDPILCCLGHVLFG